MRKHLVTFVQKSALQWTIFLPNGFTGLFHVLSLSNVVISVWTSLSMISVWTILVFEHINNDYPHAWQDFWWHKFLPGTPLCRTSQIYWIPVVDQNNAFITIGASPIFSWIISSGANAFLLFMWTIIKIQCLLESVQLSSQISSIEKSFKCFKPPWFPLWLQCMCTLCFKGTKGLTNSCAWNRSKVSFNRPDGAKPFTEIHLWFS